MNKRDFTEQYLIARAHGHAGGMFARDVISEAEKAWDVLEEMGRPSDPVDRAAFNEMRQDNVHLRLQLSGMRERIDQLQEEILRLNTKQRYYRKRYYGLMEGKQ